MEEILGKSKLMTLSPHTKKENILFTLSHNQAIYIYIYMLMTYDISKYKKRQNIGRYKRVIFPR
jgi:hypothetical protein